MLGSRGYLCRKGNKNRAEGMSEIITRLTRLTELAERMVEARSALEVRVQELENLVSGLEQENSRLKVTLEEKEKFINILQTAKSLNTKEESEEARKKVDDLVREVEHCLKLLDS